MIENMDFDKFIKTAPDSVLQRLIELRGMRERPDFHPEDSVFEHIKIVTERLIKTNDIDLVFAGILHDIGKLDTVKINTKTGFPTSPGHDDFAFKLIMNDVDIQNWITTNGGDFNKVALICKNHMRFHQIGNMREFKKKQYITTWTDADIFDKLQMMGAADNMLEDFDIDNIKKSFKWKE